MSEQNTQIAWQAYLAAELPKITAILKRHDYTLAPDQPHLKGERFLMQAMTTTSGKKLILIGTKDQKQVVIKVTRDKSGKKELEHERLCRQAIHEIDFAYDTFRSPTEVAYFSEGGFLFSIQEFITQTTTFLERPLEERFDLSLHAFLIQERARATTSGHFRRTARLFGNRTSKEYLTLFSSFEQFLQNENASPLIFSRISQAKIRLEKQPEHIDQYCGFLTHTDLVPHNFRVKDNALYLLDFSSFRFGNKHESWARFLNFMTLYDPALETALIKYLVNNRAPEEKISLQLMRLFKLGEIISYYTKVTKNSTGELAELNRARIDFWSEVLAAELTDTRVSREIVAAYQATRDRLRSQDEKERQVGLH